MGGESAETIVGPDSRDSTFNLGYTEGLEKYHHNV